MTSNTAMNNRVLVWLRRDLRIADNPALYHACRSGKAVAAIYVLTDTQWNIHNIGSNHRWFLMKTLTALKEKLARLNIPLVLLYGKTYKGTTKALADYCKTQQIDGLYFNKELEINEQHRDKEVANALASQNIQVCCFEEQTLVQPGKILTKEQNYFRVFTPFKRAFVDYLERSNLSVAPLPKPAKRKLPMAIDDTGVQIPEYQKTCSYNWEAGEAAAVKQLNRFISHRIDEYDSLRDFPIAENTSRLSPYLAVGAISIRQCFDEAVRQNEGKLMGNNSGINTWINELIWREFYKHLLVGFPGLNKGHNFNTQYQGIPWRKDSKSLRAWCNGETGYPIIDAAMKQLHEEGWMHNRLRMVVAMFLTKHLLIDWRVGEQYFCEHLIDIDLAANNGGWQWSASTGADAAPYFRIFNPVRQSQRFDPDGEFITLYLPNLAPLSKKSIHCPSPMEAATVSYPLPIVEHSYAVERAKQTFKSALEADQGIRETAI